MVEDGREGRLEDRLLDGPMTGQKGVDVGRVHLELMLSVEDEGRKSRNGAVKARRSIMVLAQWLQESVRALNLEKESA